MSALYSRSDSRRASSSSSPLYRRTSGENAPPASQWTGRTSFKGPGGRASTESAPPTADLTSRARPITPRNSAHPLARRTLDAAPGADKSAMAGAEVDRGRRSMDRSRPAENGRLMPPAVGGCSEYPPPGGTALTGTPRRPSSSHGGCDDSAMSPPRTTSLVAANPSTNFSAGTARGITGGRMAAPAKATLGRDGRPISYVCYLCGAQFGSKSLFIHIGKCQEKWQMKEAEKPRQERRKLPLPPAELESGELPTAPDAIDDFNARMFDYYNKCSLCQCPHCGRSFNEEAFARHAAMCTAERPGGPLAKSGGKGMFGTGASRMGAGGGGAGGGGGWPAQKPRAYVCYLCGQQYGSQSLKIHIPSCQEKFVKVNANKSKEDRRRLPPMPAELEGPLPTDPDEIDAFNARMFDYYNGVSLCQCPNCGRSFNSEAFERHRNICTADNPGGPHAKGAKRPGSFGPGPPKAAASDGAKRPGTSGGASAPPRAYMCYLCGQQYGSQSLGIHVPKCLEMWAKVNGGKPAHEQRAPPPLPLELQQPLPTDPVGIDAFNNKMADIFNGASLTPCPHCGRTFRDEAFRNHTKVCTAERPFKSAQQRAPPQSAAAGAPGPTSAAPSQGGDGEPAAAMGQCSNCGRKFNLQALERHERVCASVFKKKELPAEATQRAPRAPAARPPPLPRASDDAGKPRGGESDTGACSRCGRTFSTAALARHEAVCAKAFKGAGGAGPARAAADAMPPDAADEASAAYQAGGAGASIAAAYPDYDDAGQGYDAEGGELSQCRMCGRSFNSQALARHERICGKVFQTKRKPMNMTAQRLSGMEGAGKLPSSSKLGPSKLAAASRPAAGKDAQKAKWRAQSEEMRAAMKASREVSRRLAAGESLADMPYVPSAPDPSLIQCPHCGRRYNDKAAERHIPLCANIINKPKFLKAGTGGAGKGAPVMYKHVPKR